MRVLVLGGILSSLVPMLLLLPALVVSWLTGGSLPTSPALAEFHVRRWAAVQVCYLIR